MFRNITSILAAAVLIGAIAPAASADPTVKTMSIAVSYADLDLSKAAGAETLMRRIKSTAKKVCGGSKMRMPSNIAAEQALCRREAVAAAVAEVDAPVLTALFMGRKGLTQMASR